MWSHLLESARCSFFRRRSLFLLNKKFRMATHILECREQLRPVLKAAVDAKALKRGASGSGPPARRARSGSARAGAWPRSRGSSSWRAACQQEDRQAAAVLLAAKSATFAALERVEKARKELDEASRELLHCVNLQGSSTNSL